MPLSQCLSIPDLSVAQLSHVLKLAHQMKATPSAYNDCLAGQSIALLFEKPSLRTRVSFDVGIHQLGGHSVYLNQQQVGPGSRETVTDIARNLQCWTQAIVARVYSHQTLQELAASGATVVNALCDQHHPCQTLADLMTLQECFGADLHGLKVAYIGDGNNVCQSLMLGAAAAGIELTVITPAGFGPGQSIKDMLEQMYPGHKVRCSHNSEQLGQQDVLYTDTWVSMGEDESKADAKKAVFWPYQLNSALLQRSGAKHVMHCLPAHRGEEITNDVLDSSASVVLHQAENRMHAQKALLALLLNEEMKKEFNKEDA